MPSLSAKQLLAHFNKRAPEQFIAAWKGSKVALIAKIEALPPLAAPEPTPTPAAELTPESFSVAAYAKQHNLDGRELRKQLRAAGLRAPYTLEQVTAVVKS